MSIFISKNFTAAFLFSKNKSRIEIELDLISIDEKSTISLGKYKLDGIDNFFIEVKEQLRIADALIHNSENVLNFQRKHWRQYRNNSYHIYDFFHDVKDGRVLFFLESYAKIFSMEMAIYLQSLNAFDSQFLEGYLNTSIDKDDPFYSDLIEIKSFYTMYKNSIQK